MKLIQFLTIFLIASPALAKTFPLNPSLFLEAKGVVLKCLHNSRVLPTCSSYFGLRPAVTSSVNGGFKTNAYIKLHGQIVSLVIYTAGGMDGDETSIQFYSAARNLIAQYDLTDDDVTSGADALMALFK